MNRKFFFSETSETLPHPSEGKNFIQVCKWQMGSYRSSKGKCYSLCLRTACCPDLPGHRLWATKAHTGSLCSVPSEEAETCRRQAMTPHAPPCPPEPIVLLGSDCFQLGCPPMRAEAGSTQVLCPATVFLQQAQDSQSRDLALIIRLLNAAWFVSDWEFSGKIY